MLTTAPDATLSPPAGDGTATDTPTHTPAAGAQSVAPGAGAIDPNSPLAQKLNGAAASAVDQFLAGSKKRPGQRGPDQKPRKPRAKNIVPLESLGNAAPDPLLEEGTPTPLGGVVVESPAFDEETARQVIEIGVGLLNDGASAIVRAIAKKETGDQKLAEDAAKEVRMGDKVEGAIKLGSMQCAKKYAVQTKYAPELLLGGGLVIWAGQVAASVRALKQTGAALREAHQAKAA